MLIVTIFKVNHYPPAARISGQQNGPPLGQISGGSDLQTAAHELFTNSRVLGWGYRPTYGRTVPDGPAMASKPLSGVDFLGPHPKDAGLCKEIGQAA